MLLICAMSGVIVSSLFILDVKLTCDESFTGSEDTRTSRRMQS